MPHTVRQAAVIPVADGLVCLVTSSSGRRWVIPKGMIDQGNSAGEAALVEAWEEAGLVGVLWPEPVGSYVYKKYDRWYHVTVFLMNVTEMAPDWPERDIRKREWLEPERAIERIDEEGLRQVILASNRIPEWENVRPTIR
jgi:8-oxo-dGTP pyrophosphatase MutT (NUDIX family)